MSFCVTLTLRLPIPSSVQGGLSRGSPLTASHRALPAGGERGTPRNSIPTTWPANVPRAGAAWATGQGQGGWGHGLSPSPGAAQPPFPLLTERISKACPASKEVSVAYKSSGGNYGAGRFFFFLEIKWRHWFIAGKCYTSTCQVAGEASLPTACSSPVPPSRYQHTSPVATATPSVLQSAQGQLLLPTHGELG